MDDPPTARTWAPDTPAPLAVVMRPLTDASDALAGRPVERNPTDRIVARATVIERTCTPVRPAISFKVAHFVGANRQLRIRNHVIHEVVISVLWCARYVAHCHDE